MVRWPLVFGLIALITIACMAPTETPALTVPQQQGQQVVFEGATFNVELAVTLEQRARGLIGREHLGDREGMLFVQEMEGIYSFGMGGMVIPLDILWMDADGVVAGVTANVSPDPRRDDLCELLPTSTGTICPGDQSRSGGVGGN